jgi:zinc D-Ala-D-Ala carboxypeptidase
MSFKYFTDVELACSHCQESKMDSRFMEMIEALREELGFPFVVTSAYRCPQHPVEARKKLSGAHSTGRAMDLAVQGENAYKLLCGALKAGFTGIGVNQKGSSRFIHLDNIKSSDGSRRRPWVWSY